MVREVKDGQYAHEAGAKYRLEVTDSAGAPARRSRGDALGVRHLPRPPAARPRRARRGRTRSASIAPGGSEFAGQFEVRAYQVRKVEVAIDLPRTVYYRGETIKADVVARDATGIPLANRPVVVQLPDGRTLSARHRRARANSPSSCRPTASPRTRPCGSSRSSRRTAWPTAGNVHARRPGLRHRPDDGPRRLSRRRVVHPRRQDPRRRRRPDRAGACRLGPQSASRRFARSPSARSRRRRSRPTTKTGKGSAELVVEDEDGGSFVVRVAGTDRFGNPVVAEKLLTISGKEDATPPAHPGRSAGIQGRRDGEGQPPQPGRRPARRSWPGRPIASSPTSSSR